MDEEKVDRGHVPDGSENDDQRIGPELRRGGIGTRFSTNAYISMNPSTARASKNGALSGRINPTQYETTITAANSRPHRSVPTGPASETAESHQRFRSAPRLM